MGNGASAKKSQTQTKKVYVVKKDENATADGGDSEEDNQLALATIPKQDEAGAVSQQPRAAHSLASVALASSGGGIDNSSSAAALLAAAGVRPSSRERPASRERVANREAVDKETMQVKGKESPRPQQQGGNSTKLVSGSQGRDPAEASSTKAATTPLAKASGKSESDETSAILVEVDVTSEDEKSVRNVTTDNFNSGSKSGPSTAAPKDEDFMALCSRVQASAAGDAKAGGFLSDSDDEDDNDKVGQERMHSRAGSRPALCLTRPDGFRPAKGVQDAPSNDRQKIVKPAATVCSAPTRSTRPAAKNPRESVEYKSRAAERDRWLESLGVVREEESKAVPKKGLVEVTVAVPLRDTAESVKEDANRWIARMQRHERGSFGSALLVASRSFTGDSDLEEETV